MTFIQSIIKLGLKKADSEVTPRAVKAWYRYPDPESKAAVKKLLIDFGFEEDTRYWKHGDYHVVLDNGDGLLYHAKFKANPVGRRAKIARDHGMDF